MQIVYENAARWVTAKYLSKTKPSAGSPDPSWAGGARACSPTRSRCTARSRGQFPQIITFYGVRRDPIPDHPVRAGAGPDDPELQVARPARRSAARWPPGPGRTRKSLGIKYVIWNQRIWNIQRDNEGWRYMANRGGDSANHKNHVHITVYSG